MFHVGKISLLVLSVLVGSKAFAAPSHQANAQPQMSRSEATQGSRGAGYDLNFNAALCGVDGPNIGRFQTDSRSENPRNRGFDDHNNDS